MRKWRGRKRRQDQGENAAPAQEPLQPAYPGMHEDEAPPEESLPAEAEIEEPRAEAESAENESAEGESAQTAGKSGRSRRRRKKKPAAAPQQSSEPLQPAYSDTEGPRPLVALKPGGPTGEAAELAEPVVEPEVEPAPAAAPVAPETPAPKKASKGAVVLAVGLPGSGKTTWFKRRGVTPLSSDLLRSLLFDDPTEQRHQDLVFSSLRSLLRARLIARMPMNYVDATNLSPKERRHWIRMAHEFGYDAHAVYFEVPLEICSERNRRRQRVVPEDVMQRMSNKLRPPTFDEGFAKIIVVRVKRTLPEGGAEAAAQQSSSDVPAAESEANADHRSPTVVDESQQGSAGDYRSTTSDESKAPVHEDSHASLEEGEEGEE